MPNGAEIIVMALVPLLLMWFLGVHKVEEGHVGIYFSGGAIVEGFTEPGYHVMIPFLTEFHNIQVNL